MGAVAWGLWPTPRFPSPLIKPGVPISGTRFPTGFTARHTTAGRSLLVSGDDTSARDGLRQAVELSLSPAGYPTEPLVSYQINRQLSGWNLPPLVIRAFGAHCQ
jgi:hypothetical protein